MQKQMVERFDCPIHDTTLAELAYHGLELQDAADRLLGLNVHVCIEQEDKECTSHFFCDWCDTHLLGSPFFFLITLPFLVFSSTVLDITGLVDYAQSL